MQVLTTAPRLPRQVRWCPLSRRACKCSPRRRPPSTGTLVPTEPTSELANEPSTTIPLSLLTMVQVLVMGDEEVIAYDCL